MQIHELNDFSGARGSGSYVAVDDGNDTGKLSIEQLLSNTENEVKALDTALNARIDNIIAGGTAPSAAEVTDARTGVGGRNFASLGAAIRGQVSELLEGFAALSAAEFSVDNYFLNSIGQPSANNTYHCTDFIEYVPGSAVGIVDAFAGSSSLAIAFYDEQQGFISGVNNVNGSAVVPASQVPPNTKYIRFGSAKTFDGASYDSVALISPANVAAYIADVQTLFSDNTLINEKINGLKLSLYESGYLNTIGEEIDNAAYSRTGFINFSENDRFELIDFYNGASSIAYAFYDSTKTFISGSGSVDGNLSSDTITIPSGTAFVRFSTWTAQRPNACIYINNTVGNQKASDAGINELKNAQVLIFGDSITDCCNITVNAYKETTAYAWRNPSNSYVNAGGTTINYSMWPKILKESEPCGEIRNYAYSGASYKTAARSPGNERQNLHYQIDVALNDYDNPNNVFSVANYVPDIVIFALGTNDGVPNDTYESAMSKTVYQSDGVSIDTAATISALDTSKFCESARSAFMRIKTAFPMAQIYCVLPIQRADNDTNLGDLHKYLKEMAERYGCIIVDGAFGTGITRDFNNWNALGTYLKDGLHPNEKGQNLLARAIIKSLKSNYMPFGAGFNS